MIRNIRTFLGAAVLGVAATALSPSASAAIVTGNWDPTLTSLGDGRFNGLGWTATVNVNVADDCIRDDGSTPWVANRTIRIFGARFNCSNPIPILDLAGSPFSILSAELAFYGLGDGRLKKVFTLDETTFTPQLLKLGENSEILYLLSSTDSDIVSYEGYEFRLGLPGQDPVLRYRSGTTGTFRTATDPVTDTLFFVTQGQDANTVIQMTRLVEGDLVFNRVPEPGSLVLAALALAGAGLARSQRARRAT